MTTLQPLRTFSLDGATSNEFPSLLSPSTFNLSSSAYAFSGDYATPSYDFSTLNSGPYDPPSPAGSVPSLSHSSSSPALSDRVSSPSSSFHDTPRGSPAMAKDVVLLSSSYGGAYDSQYDGSVFQGSQEFVKQESAQHFDFEGCSPLVHSLEQQVDDGMYSHTQGQHQHQGVQVPLSSSSYQLPSPAHSPASLGMPIPQHVDQQASYQSHYQPQQHQQSQHQHEQQQAYYSSSSSSSPVYDHSQAIYQQQQQPLQYQPPQVPLVQAQPGAPVAQLVTINGVTYAVAMPVQAPAPAAIETPHGTYYFVPSAPQQQQQQVQQQHQSDSSSSFVLSSGLPAPVANSIPGLDMSGLPAFTSPVAQHQSHHQSHQHQSLPSIASVVPQVAPTALDPQQKIRLPVGQGKRGSTKRAPKKDQVKRFVCPFDGCGRGFARNFNMQSHYKSHLGVREFNCPHCTKKFSRRHDRARHCAAVHDSHVDREGNVLGASTGTYSATSSPSSSHDHEHDHHDEHDELTEDVVGLSPYDLDLVNFA